MSLYLSTTIRPLSYLLFLLFLFLIPKVSSLTCYTNDTHHQNNSCTKESSYAHCLVYIQINPKPILTHQYCYEEMFPLYACNNEFTVAPNSAISYLYCCNTDYCNTLRILNEKIRDHSSSLSPSPTAHFTSSHPTMTTLLADHPFTSLSSPLSSSLSSSPLSFLSSSSYLHTNTSTHRQATIIVVAPTVEITSSSVTLPSYVIIPVTLLTVAIILFLIALVIVLFIYFNPRHVVGIAVPTESDATPTISTGSYEFSSNQDLFDDGTTSGSGAGLPVLIQQSVATQVTPCEVIGKGRFGEVWKGRYKGDWVAVKIFHTKEETSWAHEVDIYQTCLIRHPNIIGFIAADNKDIGIATQLWLITEYCQRGSLYELLVNETLNEETVIKLCLTAACGLAHLHSEITGIEGKPAIAHRDIKSRNILVKSDYSCCIADLGLALRYYKSTDTVEEPPTKRVGTRRYLSPEILNDSLDVKNFDFFKRSDMYSFGLVMWEIGRRGLCGGHAEEYQLPYFDWVTPDPSFEEMQRIVAVERKRPSFPNRWIQSTVFDSISHIIEGCWLHNTEGRHTALRVKKNLLRIQSEHLNKPTTMQLQVSL